MVKRMDIGKKCKAIIREVTGNDELDIKDHHSLIDDVGLDSVDFISLMMELEDEFGGSIDDEVASQINTVNDIINFIEQAQSETESK